MHSARVENLPCPRILCDTSLVTIEDRDRKILWARAHNSCAICKTTLVLDRIGHDRESVIGDEAHIVARSKGGPRGGSISSSDLDRYDNLILLCKVHHKQVDDQPSTFTVERLLELKAEHEQWAHAKFEAPVVSQSGPAAIDLDQPARASLPTIASQTTAADIVVTTYPIKNKFTVHRNDFETSYDVPAEFEMLLLDLEHIFEVALHRTGTPPENVWWRMQFDPSDAINEYTTRRITFVAEPGHVRPPFGISIVVEEGGITTARGHRPDLDWPEWRGGGGTGPVKLQSLIFILNLRTTRAIKDGYQFDGPWIFRIIDDPDKGKCVEGFCRASWTKPQRWRVSPH